uniref:uncharacterized protein n=1 Tax=Pristiophorus japonicus TaxID=55135 RepID=UPI00398F8482
MCIQGVLGENITPNSTIMNKSAKNSPLLTVDAHLRNKKEDMLLHIRLDHLHRGHCIVLSTLQQESATVTEELQNMLRQKSILRKFKLDDLIMQLKTINMRDKTEMNSNWDSKARGTMAASTQSNLQRVSLLGTWAGLNGRTSPSSFVQDELDERLSTNQFVKKGSHMSASVRKSSSRPSGFRRPKSTAFLQGRIADGGDIQSLTHKELRRMASIENIYQKELERQKQDRLQERVQWKKFMDEKMKEKINNFIMTLDKSVK